MKLDKAVLFSLLVIFSGLFILYKSSAIWQENNNLRAKYERTFGRVSAITPLSDGQNYPVILFITQDSQKVYYKAFSETSKKKVWDIGDEIELYYDLINPTDVHLKPISGFWVYLGFIVGGAISLIGVYFLFVHFRKQLLRNRLVSNGKKIKANVSGIGFVPPNVLGKNLFVVDCTWQRHDGMTFSFRSEPQESDPTSKYPVGSSIDVIIDINEPSNYWVEV